MPKWSISWVQFVGWALHDEVFIVPHLVPHGRPLPGTPGKVQRFERGSYFVPESRLSGASDFVSRFSVTEADVEAFAVTGRVWRWGGR